LQYLPFGETRVDQRTSYWNSRYSFSGKEKDEESGYSYFGARYYDSDLSIWLSVDPLSDKYPGLSPYVYCANNPIRLIDPDGRFFGDFYSRTGDWLGNDGKDDQKIYLQDDNGSTFYTPIGTSFTEVGGLIIQNRIEEGTDYTISEFKTVGGESSVSGYMLEPAGPSTTVANQDQRIPEGVYDVDSYSSTKYPDNFILSNDDVSKSRKILYHTGNTGDHTSGCNIPGSTKGDGRVNSSKAKMDELRNFIKGVGNLVNSNSYGNKTVKTIIVNGIE
jgi:RHS repeat-associated protein